MKDENIYDGEKVPPHAITQMRRGVVVGGFAFRATKYDADAIRASTERRRIQLDHFADAGAAIFMPRRLHPRRS